MNNAAGVLAHKVTVVSKKRTVYRSACHRNEDRAVLRHEIPVGVVEGECVGINTDSLGLADKTLIDNVNNIGADENSVAGRTALEYHLLNVNNIVSAYVLLVCLESLVSHKDHIDVGVLEILRLLYAVVKLDIGNASCAVNNNRLDPGILSLLNTVDLSNGIVDEGTETDDLSAVRVLNGDKACGNGGGSAVDSDLLANAVNGSNAPCLNCRSGTYSRSGCVEVNHKAFNETGGISNRNSSGCVACGGNGGKDTARVAKERAGYIPLSSCVRRSYLLIERIEYSAIGTGCELHGLIGDLNVNVHISRLDLEALITLTACGRSGLTFCAKAEAAVNTYGSTRLDDIGSEGGFLDLLKEGGRLDTELITKSGEIVVLYYLGKSVKSLCHNKNSPFLLSYIFLIKLRAIVFDSPKFFGALGGVAGTGPLPAILGAPACVLCVFSAFFCAIIRITSSLSNASSAISIAVRAGAGFCAARPFAKR